MRVFLETSLPCRPDAAWIAVGTVSLLRTVAWPVLTFRPVDSDALPDRWEQQETVRFRLFLFGLIPLGRHELHFERIVDAGREIQTRERGLLVNRWDHLIRIRESGEGTCRYSDDVTIEAGWRTPIIWLFAQLFYRHRQRRWMAVARRLDSRRRDSAA